MMVSVLSDFEKINCIKLYQLGKSCNDIAKIYGVSRVAIQGILKRRGIKLRSQSENKRTYKCDEHFFDRIDTEAKAYFFGLLYADGCNLNSRNNITLSLQERDKHILETMTELIQPNKPLQFINLKDKNPNWNNHYRIVICSEHMCKVLNDFGLVPRKSLVKKFPEVIFNSNKDIQRHFIRGYYDGNGSISLSKYNNTYIEYCSTYEFLTTILIILDLNHDCYRMSQRNKGSNSWSLRFWRYSDILYIVDYIFSGSNLYIQRKYDEIKYVCEFILKRT